MCDFDTRIEIQALKEEIRKTNQLLQELKDFAAQMFEKKIIDDDVLS